MIGFLGRVGCGWLCLLSLGCIVSCFVPVGSVILGLCSWFRGSSLLHTFGQLPNSTVLTFTTRRALQSKPEEISRQWVFLGETIAQRCASPGRRRRPICATGLSFWQLAYSCECFSNSLALAFGSSGVFLFAAYVLFLLFCSFSCWPRHSGPCLASALRAGLAWSRTDVVAVPS